MNALVAILGAILDLDQTYTLNQDIQLDFARAPGTQYACRFQASNVFTMAIHNIYYLAAILDTILAAIYDNDQP